MLDRRHFLRLFGLAGTALTLPAAVNAESGSSVSVRKFSGRVLSAGKGLKGVVVSDGYEVAVTDHSGKYELTGNGLSEFVFISIPAGYSIPVEKGAAQFYVAVPGEATSFRHDFILEKLAVDDRKHQFVVWADTQILSAEDAQLLKTQSAPDLKQLVAGYPKEALFHGIGCGDLVWDKFDLFGDYREALELTGIPFFNVIGNHDMDIDARTDDASAKTFKQQFGPTYYSFNRGDVHYVILDDVFFIGNSKKYIGYLTENQLKWLERDLSHVKPGSTVVVNLHIPVNTGAARRNNKEEELGGVVSNRKQLYKILEPFRTHIMSGHTHMNEKVLENNLIGHVHGTVCGAWWSGPVCSDGTPNGYAVYEVNGSEITWYYKSTGKERSHQLRIYPRGSLKAFPGHVVANVWNWDPEWNIEWLEDGVSRGRMEQRVDLDPWAFELYTGNQLPKKHKWIEPTLTDHLFFAYPAPGTKEVTVKATDRFGNRYEEKIVLG